MALTPFMNLDLPTVSVTLGPEWAEEINAALETIDDHDHSTDNGAKITPLGLNINSSLDFKTNRAIELFATQYVDHGSPLTGVSNIRAVSVSGGDLYYTNNAGVAIQLTAGGTLVSSPGATNTFSSVFPAGDLVILPGDTFSYIAVDTSSPRTITLPAAGSVTAGRFYTIKDKTGTASANNISISPNGGDTIDLVGGSAVVRSDFSATLLVSDGVSNWYLS